MHVATLPSQQGLAFADRNAGHSGKMSILVFIMINFEDFNQQAITKKKGTIGLFGAQGFVGAAEVGIISPLVIIKRCLIGRNTTKWNSTLCDWHK